MSVLILGCVFEDFEIGQVFKYFFGCIVMMIDNIWFMLFINNLNLIYFDYVFVVKIEWKKLFVNLVFIIVLVIGFIVFDFLQNVVNFGWDKVCFFKLFFEGEIVYVQSEVFIKCEFVFWLYQGIVNFKMIGFIEIGKVIIIFECMMFVYKSGYVLFKLELLEIVEQVFEREFEKVCLKCLFGFFILICSVGMLVEV